MYTALISVMWGLVTNPVWISTSPLSSWMLGLYFIFLCKVYACKIYLAYIYFWDNFVFANVCDEVKEERREKNSRPYKLCMKFSSTRSTNVKQNPQTPHFNFILISLISFLSFSFFENLFFHSKIGGGGWGSIDGGGRGLCTDSCWTYIQVDEFQNMRNTIKMDLLKKVWVFW